MRRYDNPRQETTKVDYLYPLVVSRDYVCLERQYSRSINIVGKDDGIRMGGPRKQVEEVAWAAGFGLGNYTTRLPYPQ